MEAQPSLLDWKPPRVGNDFGGITYDRKRDQNRLDSQQQLVYQIMLDGLPHTIPDVYAVVKRKIPKATEGSVGARIRDLRKPKVLGATVERKHIGGGLFTYRMLPPEQWGQTSG